MEQSYVNQENVKEESSIDLKKIFFKYFSYWKWFLLSFLIFMALGGTYLFVVTPLYKINASILVKDEKKTGGTATMLEELDLFSGKKIVENEMEILRSYTLSEEVVKDLNLQVKYTVKKGVRTHEIYNNAPIKIEVISPAPELFEKPLTVNLDKERIRINGKSYPKNAIITESFGSIRTTVYDSLSDNCKSNETIYALVSPVRTVAESLRENLQVSTSAKGTSVLSLSILSPIPKKGEDILNQLITVYNRAAIADKNNLAGITLSFIDERLKLLSVDLQDAEQKVETYKAAEGITNISAESELFLQAVQQNDLELNKVSIQLDVLQHIEEYVLSNDNNRGGTPATLGINDPTLLSLIESLTKAETERAKTLRTTKAAHPAMQAIDNQINELKRSIIDNIQVLRRSLEITQRKLKSENRRIEMMIQSVPRKERQLVDITRQQEIKNQLYVYLLSKREETAISYASTVADSRLVDAARSSQQPVKPVKRNIILIFALLGLFFPVAVLWIRDQFNDKIESVDEIEKKVQAPILGEISFLSKSNKTLSMVKTHGRQAEQIRTLRTNLEFMQTGGVRSILITSSIGGEGKSFLTANLGNAFAALGKRVILLGFDLRKPGLHKVFGIENTIGISNYLVGQNSLQQIIHKIDQEGNLDLITCGHIPPNPQELLQGGTLPKLMEELKRQYDYVIIDTPPIGLVSDAQFLSRYADASVFVMRQSYTPKDQIKLVNSLFKEKRLGNFGVVINGIKDDKWYGYYGVHKYYGHYCEEENTKG